MKNAKLQKKDQARSFDTYNFLKKQKDVFCRN